MEQFSNRPARLGRNISSQSRPQAADAQETSAKQLSGDRQSHLRGDRSSNSCAGQLLRNRASGIAIERLDSIRVLRGIWPYRPALPHFQRTRGAVTFPYRGAAPPRIRRCSPVPTPDQPCALPGMQQSWGFHCGFRVVPRPPFQSPMQSSGNTAGRPCSQTDSHTAAGTSARQTDSGARGPRWREYPRRWRV